MTAPIGPPGPSAAGPDLEDLRVTEVEDVLQALAAALRDYRLYETNNPMRERFVAALQGKLGGLWDKLPALRLEIDEGRILWEGERVFPSGDAGGDLPFLFYRDGIRAVTLLPGCEQREVLALLGVLARAPSVKREEDDLVTLLWQEDLTRIRYEAVEATEEALAQEEGAAPPPEPIDPATVRREAAAPRTVSTDDFQETLYFLDDAELRRLREEVQRENQRDLWADVLNALLDRLEDGDATRQQRIVGILGELLPSALGSGQFGRAGALLEELAGLASRPGLVGPQALREVRTLFDVLGKEETVLQLADVLEEMPDRITDEAVVRLLGLFPPSSIGALMRAAERAARPDVRRALEACVQRLAEANRDYVLQLLGAEDVAVLAGALRWVGRLEIGAAASEVVRLLPHPEPAVREAAVEALVALRAAAAARSLLPLMKDPERDVRVAAVRALGALSHAPAREPLEKALSSRALRDADRGEKVAFFEAFGRLAGPDGVPVLDRILQSRSWLGRGASAELRACAALGLAQIRHPEARASLEGAAHDPDPVVRAAVGRALRVEER